MNVNNTKFFCKKCEPSIFAGSKFDDLKFKIANKFFDVFLKRASTRFDTFLMPKKSTYLV